MPRIGALGVCQKCDGKIVFNGEEWKHRPGTYVLITHKAQPKGKK